MLWVHKVNEKESRILMYFYLLPWELVFWSNKAHFLDSQKLSRSVTLLLLSKENKFFQGFSSSVLFQFSSPTNVTKCEWAFVVFIFWSSKKPPKSQTTIKRQKISNGNFTFKIFFLDLTLKQAWIICGKPFLEAEFIRWWWWRN